MRIYTTVQASEEACQHIEDAARGLSYTITTVAAPVQVEGFVHGTPFYFRARGTGYRMAISEDAAVLPNHMTEKDAGFFVRAVVDDELELNEVEDMIERFAALYLEHRKSTRPLSMST